MEDNDLSKGDFMRLLGVRPTNIYAEKNKTELLEKRTPTTANEKINLLEKNNNTKTGYEDFCIMKGELKLLPFKDFDFIDRKIVCQKCYKTFGTRNSYGEHVNTDVCVTTYDGKNLVYLKYKNRKRKKGYTFTSKCEENEIKNNLLDPEKINVLETRNRCYSHDRAGQISNNKRKRVTKPNQNEEPIAKKPRDKKDTEAETKKPRGRPKKIIAETAVGNSNTTDHRLNNKIENNETGLNDTGIAIVVDSGIIKKRRGRPKKIIAESAVGDSNTTDHGLNNIPN